MNHKTNGTMRKCSRSFQWMVLSVGFANLNKSFGQFLCPALGDLCRHQSFIFMKSLISFDWHSAKLQTQLAFSGRNFSQFKFFVYIFFIYLSIYHVITRGNSFVIWQIIGHELCVKLWDVAIISIIFSRTYFVFWHRTYFKEFSDETFAGMQRIW
jgi:hypothetical protein